MKKEAGKGFQMRNPAFLPPFFGSVPNLRVCARGGEKIKTKMQTNEEKENIRAGKISNGCGRDME